MKIDHLVADVDRTGVCVLDHLQAEAAIEGQHLLGVLHGKGHVIEAPDSRSARCAAARDPPANAPSRGNAADESSTVKCRCFIAHLSIKKLWIGQRPARLISELK